MDLNAKSFKHLGSQNFDRQGKKNFKPKPSMCAVYRILDIRRICRNANTEPSKHVGYRFPRAEQIEPLASEVYRNLNTEPSRCVGYQSLGLWIVETRTSEPYKHVCVLNPRPCLHVLYPWLLIKVWRNSNTDLYRVYCIKRSTLEPFKHAGQGYQTDDLRSITHNWLYQVF